jgi:hypothetical protein
VIRGPRGERVWGGGGRVGRRADARGKARVRGEGAEVDGQR